MYTIKILQRLIDRGTHNSIFAFVLLILKNHFQRASLRAEEQSRRPRRALQPHRKNSTPSPALDLHLKPRLATMLEPPIEKGKLPETRLSKNTAPELCERTFFNCLPPVSAVTFAGLSSDSSNPGFARGVDQTPNRRAVQATFSQNAKLFWSFDSSLKKPPPPPHGAGHWENRSTGKACLAQWGRAPDEKRRLTEVPNFTPPNSSDRPRLASQRRAPWLAGGRTYSAFTRSQLPRAAFFSEKVLPESGRVHRAKNARPLKSQPPGPSPDSRRTRMPRLGGKEKIPYALTCASGSGLFLKRARSRGRSRAEQTKRKDRLSARCFGGADRPGTRRHLAQPGAEQAEGVHQFPPSGDAEAGSGKKPSANAARMRSRRPAELP